MYSQTHWHTRTHQDTPAHVCTGICAHRDKSSGVLGGAIFASVQNLEEKTEDDKREGHKCVCVFVKMCNKESWPLVNGAIHHSLLGIGLGV